MKWTIWKSMIVAAALCSSATASPPLMDGHSKYCCCATDDAGNHHYFLKMCPEDSGCVWPDDAKIDCEGLPATRFNARGPLDPFHQIVLDEIDEAVIRIAERTWVELHERPLDHPLYPFWETSLRFVVIELSWRYLGDLRR
ncbi:MAG: hypothetical protein ACPGXK_00060 [Phycisphaerae bacterium]